MKKNYRRLIKNNLGLKRCLQEKEVNYMLNRKVMIIHLTAGVIKKI